MRDMNKVLRLDNIMEQVEGWKEPMYAQCCVCQRYRTADREFTSIPPDKLEEIAQQDRERNNVFNDKLSYTISHTYCHPCTDKERKKYEQSRRV